MNQPPESEPFKDAPHVNAGSPISSALPQWRRPQGVAAGTWTYVNERSIADHYDAFVAGTPLCSMDESVLAELFPGSQQADWDRETVLDLGCGSGRSAIALANRGYRVVGIDLSQSMLERCCEKRIAGDGCVSLLRANLVQLDGLADHSADHAVCLFSTLGMIQGRQNRCQMLKHVHRMIRPGGSLLLHVHHRWAALKEYQGLRQLAKSWWQSVIHRQIEFGDSTYSYRGLDGMFMHRFSSRELQSDLTACGWRIAWVKPLTIEGGRSTRAFEIAGGFLVHAIA